jgi:hypothetical protein
MGAEETPERLERGFVDFINQLAAEGITGSCGGGNPGPANLVNRGQMSVFLVKTFQLLLYGS